MVDQLQGIVRQIEKKVQLNDGDLLIDIASNDGTLLNAYKNRNLKFIGIDPAAEKFKEFYKSDIIRSSEFFSRDAIKKHLEQKAKVITSVAVFYDLEEPLKFMHDVEQLLDDEGVWVLEQSYLPKMIEQTSYDTICHEHLEYYALQQIDWMAKHSGLKILDVEFNGANGGSFRVSVAKDISQHIPNKEKIAAVLKAEKNQGYDDMFVYNEFTARTLKYKQELVSLLQELNIKKKKVFGYGASTKGNVILQYCGITNKDLPYIAEVNDYKFGRVTPGTNIPIISEEQAKMMEPDFMLVLPWHFKDNILKREEKYLKNGGHLIFPLPETEIV